MKSLILILATIGAIAGGRYIYSAIQTKQIVDNLSNPTSSPVTTEADAKKGFMSGCDTNQYDRQTEYCGCMYDQMRKVSSINQLTNDGLTLTAEELQTKYQQQSSFCLTVVYGSEGV